jgi:sugar O-acyltransferase (sialic acid O-acetyltransferase NeuD family)
MSAQTVIYGAGRQGIIVLETLRAIGKTEVIGFLDDDATKHGTTFHELPVLGGMDWAQANRSGRSLGAIVAIGSNDARTAIGDKLREGGFELLNVVHPSVVMMSGVSMGSGNLICAGAILIEGTQIEDDIVINSGAILEHDSMLHTGAQIATGVHTAGCVEVGAWAFIGVGAILGPRVVVGERSIVGAGSTVLSDIPANVIAYGNPARIIREVPNAIDWKSILARD